MIHIVSTQMRGLSLSQLAPHPPPPKAALSMQIYIDIRFNFHSAGNVFKIRGICFKLIYLMTYQYFFNF